MNYSFQNEQINAHFSIESLEHYSNSIELADAHPWFSVFIINSFDGFIRVDDEQFQSQTAAVLFITPGQIISFQGLKYWEGYKVSFNKEFYCIEYHDNEISCNGLLFVNNFRIVSILLDEQQRTIFNNTVNEITREFKSQDSLLAEMLKNLLKNLLIRSNRLFKQQCSDGEVDEASFDIVRRLSSLIETHFRTHKLVDDYAEMLAMSASSLTKKLQKTGFESPSQIIRARIITESKRLLIYSDKSIKEIADILGYDDPYYFSRIFSQTVGSSPRDFRKSCFKPDIS